MIKNGSYESVYFILTCGVNFCQEKIIAATILASSCTMAESLKLQKNLRLHQ